MAIKIEAHPYNRDLYLYLTPEAVAKGGYKHKSSRDEFVDSIAGACGVTLWGTSRGGVHVGVFDGNLCTLVHELVHAAQYILTNAGIDPLHANAEPLAYLVDDLFRRLEKPFNAAVAASKE